MRSTYLPVQNKPDPWVCIIKSTFLYLGGTHICPMHKASCKFDKDISNIKEAALILQKEPFSSKLYKSACLSYVIFVTNETHTQRLRNIIHYHAYLSLNCSDIFMIPFTLIKYESPQSTV